MRYENESVHITGGNRQTLLSVVHVDSKLKLKL